MRIFGVDFTSAPSPKKPITCAMASLDGDKLYIDGIAEFENFELFDNFLTQPGPWVAGMDFPFGQPRRLVNAMGWPSEWGRYVSKVEALGLAGFSDEIVRYRDAQPSGDKHHLRVTDRAAKACSPMMLKGVPVGRMFCEGAPRLMNAQVSVLPCRPMDPERVALETYPALVARKAIGRLSYKSENRKAGGVEREAARAKLVDSLGGELTEREYGLKLLLPMALNEDLVADHKADALDSVLCALQAAWSWRQRSAGFGMPAYADIDEGWIVDPQLTVH